MTNTLGPAPLVEELRGHIPFGHVILEEVLVALADIIESLVKIHLDATLTLELYY